MRFDCNIDLIRQELKKRTDLSRLSMDIMIRIMPRFKLVFNKLYEFYRHQDYLYNIDLKPILSSELEHISKKIVPS